MRLLLYSASFSRIGYFWSLKFTQAPSASSQELIFSLRFHIHRPDPPLCTRKLEKEMHLNFGLPEMYIWHHCLYFNFRDIFLVWPNKILYGSDQYDEMQLCIKYNSYISMQINCILLGYHCRYIISQVITAIELYIIKLPLQINHIIIVLTRR